MDKKTYILLLLIDMTDLEPDVGMGQWTWWVAKDAIKALQGLFEFALLLIDYAEPEENFVLFIKL